MPRLTSVSQQTLAGLGIAQAFPAVTYTIQSSNEFESFGNKNGPSNQFLTFSTTISNTLPFFDELEDLFEAGDTLVIYENGVEVEREVINAPSRPVATSFSFTATDNTFSGTLSDTTDGVTTVTSLIGTEFRFEKR